MRARSFWILTTLGFLLVGAGCDGKKKSKVDQAFHKPTLEKLGKAKLKVGEFKPVEKPEIYGALGCQEGRVAELAVLLCKYDTPAKAAAAAEKRLDFVGKAVTGAERVDGNLALVIADRDKKDLRGTTIQAILKAFKAEKPF